MCCIRIPKDKEIISPPAYCEPSAPPMPEDRMT